MAHEAITLYHTTNMYVLGRIEFTAQCWKIIRNRNTLFNEVLETVIMYYSLSERIMHRYEILSLDKNGIVALSLFLELNEYRCNF